MEEATVKLLCRACLVAIVLLGAAFVPDTLAGSIWEDAYQILDQARAQKKKQLLDYLTKIHRNALAVNTDTVMLSFFNLKNRYYQMQKKTPPPAEAIQSITELKHKIREHYIRNYIAFYDVLFINRQGDIFYTIRQQADYHKNLFEGHLKKSALARQLLKNPDIEFVDYQFYEVSGEPSAFYVVPIYHDEQLTGWIAFQLAINKINSIFSHDEQLGETGEVFLVNKARYMLTDSRFEGESSILRRHLSRENILAKFKEGQGHKVITDYRGYRALSSFDMCRIGQSQWLLIAKMDEDEIVTRFYRNHSLSLDKQLLARFAQAHPAPCDTTLSSEPCIQVDMDEFQKARQNTKLCTTGASTCTVLIVSYPGKFAYMSHISNQDAIYGGHTTDLLANLLKQIQTFDIYPYEKRQLKITLVASHLVTLQNALHRLVDAGYLLSQIHFLINTSAEYANPVHDNSTDTTWVRWMMDRTTGERLDSCSSNQDNVGVLVREIVVGQRAPREGD